MVLNAVVFLSGAILMALEIAGSRVLAPQFGNSIFVWGSLIGVFMAALSGGYYLGGEIGAGRQTAPERHPDRDGCAPSIRGRHPQPGRAGWGSGQGAGTGRLRPGPLRPADFYR